MAVLAVLQSVLVAALTVVAFGFMVRRIGSVVDEAVEQRTQSNLR